jgi:hypothetical protein
VFTGAGRAIGWLEVGVGLLETGVLGVGVVVPILGVVTVGLETVFGATTVTGFKPKEVD